MKFAHLADLHWSSTRLEDKCRSAAQLCTRIKDEAPDVIVVAGDLFDRPIRMEDPAAQAAAQWFRDLKDIARVIVVRGNFAHDRDSVTILQELGGGNQLVVSTEPQVIGFYSHPGLEMDVMSIEAASKQADWGYSAVFCTMPYPSQAFLAKTMTLSPGLMKEAVSAAITAAIRAYAALPIPDDVPKVLVFHGTVKGAKFSATQVEMGMDIELSPFDIGQCGFTCTMAGHLHFCQKIPTSSGPIFYPGGMTALCYGDDLPKGMWIHELKPWGYLQDESKQRLAIDLQSRHLAIDVVPMRAVEIDFSDPFFELPGLAATEVADVQLRVKLVDGDRERLAQMNWKEFFPCARSIDVVTQVEQVASVRCDDVRKAHTLREKVLAWDGQTGKLPVATDDLLKKADMLEALEPAALMTAVKEGLGL